MTERILAIIPARAGSKRIPKKNTLLLGGKSLVAWSIEAALSAKSLHQIVISSDDPEVLKIASTYPRVTGLNRPSDLAADKSPAIDYVKHALRSLAEKTADHFSIVVIIQPSSPLTLSEDINRTIELLLKNPNADSAVSVMVVKHAFHPIKFKTMSGSLLLPFISEENSRMAAHELPKVFVRNCAVYVSRRNLIESGEVIGENCLGHVMPGDRSIDINDPIDFKFAEFLISSHGK